VCKLQDELLRDDRFVMRAMELSLLHASDDMDDARFDFVTDCLGVFGVYCCRVHSDSSIFFCNRPPEFISLVNTWLHEMASRLIQRQCQRIELLYAVRLLQGAWHTSLLLELPIAMSEFNDIVHLAIEALRMTVDDEDFCCQSTSYAIDTLGLLYGARPAGSDMEDKAKSGPQVVKKSIVHLMRATRVDAGTWLPLLEHAIRKMSRKTGTVRVLPILLAAVVCRSQRLTYDSRIVRPLAMTVNKVFNIATQQMQSTDSPIHAACRFFGENVGRGKRRHTFGCFNMMCAEMAGVTDAAVPLLRCTGCHSAVYCSAKCQREDWADGHMERCSCA
jgi:hypothetical protein